MPLHDVAAFRQGDPLRGLADGGTVLRRHTRADPERIWSSIPSDRRREMLARGIRLAALDTAALAKARAPRADLVLRMQGVALVGVFLRLTPFASGRGSTGRRSSRRSGQHLQRFFGKRGDAVVDANLDLIAAAYDGVVDVTAHVTALVPTVDMSLALMEVTT